MLSRSIFGNHLSRTMSANFLFVFFPFFSPVKTVMKQKPVTSQKISVRKLALCAFSKDTVFPYTGIESATLRLYARRSIAN